MVARLRPVVLVHWEPAVALEQRRRLRTTQAEMAAPVVPATLVESAVRLRLRVRVPVASTQDRASPFPAVTAVVVALVARAVDRAAAAAPVVAVAAVAVPKAAAAPVRARVLAAAAAVAAAVLAARAALVAPVERPVSAVLVVVRLGSLPTASSMLLVL